MEKIRGVNYTTFQDLWNDKNLLTEEEKAEIIFKNTIVEDLIKAREAKGYTQTKLAELSGIKQPSLAKIESGKTMPQIDTFFKILKPLGKTLNIMDYNYK
ncbi:MAG: helix-turn-helix transcriptional regulator [Endomicrobium sp.]|jgi:DNA-binding XRE family transcriptional regulator|nr:helix-turn-helix transcriptional regulator [Endomicrobium sp.]